MVALLLVAAVPVGAHAEQRGAADLLALIHAQDVAVESVGFRLATANAALCTPGWDAGFSVHTLEQYGPAYRIAAAQAFGLREEVGILAVAAGSPAAAAGLREGDAIASVDRMRLPAVPARATVSDFTRTGAAQQLIAGAFADGVGIVSVVRSGQIVDFEVHAAPACTSIFQTVPEAGVNGEADGRYVQVSTELVGLARSQDELAALLSHEFAHNILGHRQRLDRLHVDRGLLAPIGRNARLIRATEAEADRLSIHLMARAGYPPHAALAFWERVRAATRGSAGSPTHPRWSARLQSMRAEYDLIKAAGSAHGTALPPDLAAKLSRNPPPSE